MFYGLQIRRSSHFSEKAEKQPRLSGKKAVLVNIFQVVIYVFVRTERRNSRYSFWLNRPNLIQNSQYKILKASDPVFWTLFVQIFCDMHQNSEYFLFLKRHKETTVCSLHKQSALIQKMRFWRWWHSSLEMVLNSILSILTALI